MKTSEKIAKAIRVFTIPPVFVGLLLIGCLVRGGRDFAAPWLFAAVFFFQVLAPTLAYPIQLLVPRLKAQGRDGRHTAPEFILGAAIGVAAFLICGIIIL